MKKAIIASLAVVGGITLVTTAIVSAWAAVEAAKDRKRLAEMTPEERESTIAWETRGLEIMDWLTDDVDWMTGEKHCHVELMFQFN